MAKSPPKATRPVESPRAEPTDVLRVVVGLKNPGSGYAGTRHNVGGEVVDVFAAAHGIAVKAAKRPIRADVGIGHFPGGRLVVATPRTFMNEAGQAVAPLLRYYGCLPSDLLVVHDDIDLPFARSRVQVGRGAGGNNGVRSIIGSLDTRDFWRLKIGVGRPPGRMDPAAFVLKRFGKVERQEMDEVVVTATEIVEVFAVSGGAAARDRLGSVENPEIGGNRG